MNRFKKILVAIDTLLQDNQIFQEAVDFAKANNSSLRLVDVVRPFSWISRLSIEDPDHLVDLITQEKEEKLAALAKSAQEQGVEATFEVLRGKTSVAIIRDAIANELDLVMAVSKGKNSKSKTVFGQTARRLLRQCPCALWLVVPGASPKIKHVLSCVDPASEDGADMELDQRIFEVSQTIAEYHKARRSILHSWYIEDESLLGTRLPEQRVKEFVANERQHHREKLDRFLGQYSLKADSDNVHLVKGRPADSIEIFVDSNEVDLLVIGTIGRSGIGGYFIGNTAENVLDSVECSVFALKPLGFRSSVRSE